MSETILLKGGSVASAQGAKAASNSASVGDDAGALSTKRASSPARRP